MNVSKLNTHVIERKNWVIRQELSNIMDFQPLKCSCIFQPEDHCFIKTLVINLNNFETLVSELCAEIFTISKTLRVN